MSVSTEYDIEQAVKWLDAMRDRGIFNANTARLRTTAVEQLATILVADEPKTVSYMLANIEELAERWTRKKMANPDTAAAYRSRAKLALEEFLDYQANPTTFKTKASVRSAAADGSKKAATENTPKRQSPAATRGEESSAEQGPATVQPYRSYPVTNGDLVYRLPENGITVADVRRMMLHMLTLAIDFDPIQHTNYFAITKTEN